MAQNPKQPRMDLPPIAEEKLGTSGLSLEAARELDIEFIVDASRLQKHFLPLPALVLWYHDPLGERIDFYRVRYLEEPKGFAGAAKRPPRYAQPPGQVEVYLPRVEDWPQVFLDPGVPIVITEGELKAACGAHHGFPTIGLGGVDSWRAQKRGVDLLPPLDDIRWRGRPVYIAFDSDSCSNPDVSAAMVRLADKLTSLGAIPHVVALPPGPEGKKQGMDDYIVAAGASAFDMALEHAQIIPAVRALLRMNESYAVLQDQGCVLNLSKKQRVDAGRFCSLDAADQWTVREKNTPTGVKLERVSTPKMWLGWPGRRTVPSMVYSPGGGKFLEDGSFNVWAGWKVEPKFGDCMPWVELLDYLFEGEPDARTWFERWCAYPLQNPGGKMYTAALLWGNSHGTGKSLVGYSLREIYGENWVEIGQEDLHASFNGGWAARRQFVMGEEISGSDKRTEADRLKAMVSRKELMINEKFLPQFTIPDCINYLFTSNHANSILIEDKDRRYFVHHVWQDPKPQEFYRRYEEWIIKGPRAKDGAAALFNHLLNLPMGDFSPTAPAPATRSKIAMLEAGEGDLSMLVGDFLAAPESYLVKNGAPHDAALVTPSQVLSMIDPAGEKRISPTWVGRELMQKGATFAGRYNIGGTVRRLYALRDQKYWEKARTPAIVEEWTRCYGRGVPVGSGAPAVRKKRKF